MAAVTEPAFHCYYEFKFAPSTTLDQFISLFTINYLFHKVSFVYNMLHERNLSSSPRFSLFPYQQVTPSACPLPPHSKNGTQISPDSMRDQDAATKYMRLAIELYIFLNIFLGVIVNPTETMNAEKGIKTPSRIQISDLVLM